jgi:uncharacterized membrane protein YdfJ with MMPL/SSD domain
MDRPKFICLKRAVIGFVASCLAVGVTVWAMLTYVPQSSPIYFAIGAAFATYYCMTLTLRTSVREAYRAGEVGRRLPARRRLAANDPATLKRRSGILARTVFSSDDSPESHVGLPRELVDCSTVED